MFMEIPSVQTISNFFMNGYKNKQQPLFLYQMDIFVLSSCVHIFTGSFEVFMPMRIICICTLGANVLYHVSRYVQEICNFLTFICNDQNLTAKKTTLPRLKKEMTAIVEHNCRIFIFTFWNIYLALHVKIASTWDFLMRKNPFFILFGLDTPNTFTKYLKAKNSE